MGDAIDEGRRSRVSPPPPRLITKKIAANVMCDFQLCYQSVLHTPLPAILKLNYDRMLHTYVCWDLELSQFA